MTSSTLTELALRAAVNATHRDILSGGNEPQEIKSAALKRAHELITGTNSGLTGMQMNVQATAISLAIQGIELSFFAVKEQLTNLKNKQLAFDKERLSGYATFILPTDVVEADLSKEERVIKKFISLATKNPFFETYLGVHRAPLQEMKNATFYSTFPFFRMSEVLGQPLASTRALDKQRIAINLFFRSALPESIAEIEHIFQTTHKITAFFSASWNKEKYLNELRAPRFIMMSLANLLWNLQHPVDPSTGYRVGLDNCIQLCRDAEVFINKLLDSEESFSLQEIDHERIQLLCFVRKIELQIKGLKAAYAEEQLNNLTFDDLTNSAHRTLRIMDKSIFELIYTRHNPITNKDEPDEKAADNLAYTISYLNQLINYNPELLKPFKIIATEEACLPFLNHPPATVIDVLILFLHSRTHKKQILYKHLSKDKNDSALEFISTLKKLYEKYVLPIKDISRREPNLNALIPNKTLDRKDKVALLTARRLLPLMTLVIEDYRVDVGIKRQKNPQSTTQKYKASEQVKGINALAHDNSYYYWTISPFIEMEDDTERVLDMLPKHQYRFTKITQLLDSVSEIVHSYRSFLQFKSFQQFLIKCLGKIKEEYTILEQHLSRVDECLSNDKSMSRKMDEILRAMTEDLNSSLSAFSTATRNFEHIVTDPDFTDKQKQILSSALESVNQQYNELFKDDNGLSALSSDEPFKEIAKEPPVSFVPNNLSPRADSSGCMDRINIGVLNELISKCILALSYKSQYTEKGLLLNRLLRWVEEKETLTEKEFNQTVKALARIALSYRKTTFFQASYAESRSAKVLVAALKDRQLNTLIPLNLLLLNTNDDISVWSEEQITAELRKVRKNNQWEESAELIQNITPVC